MASTPERPDEPTDGRPPTELATPDVPAIPSPEGGTDGFWPHEQKALLRFLTCGSVDDGKSTLIGRLLYDSKMVYQDQLAALRRDSAKHGTVDGDFDPALLTDGLKAEREQGITIDVAYRYFSTTRRKFIIADTPGHEQYTRNMATGASNCDLAVILLDARKGVLTQTKRHSFIVSLLGIEHVLVAINKMDLVGYDRATYERIVDDYQAFVARLDVKDINTIPLSALKGDNVVEPSPHMPWYHGPTVLEFLESVYIDADRNLQDFRFPVQFVNRPHQDYRGFAGTVASGIVRAGEEVMVLPSRRSSRIRSIVTYDGELSKAFASQAVTLTLDDEIDVSRGDMLVRPGNVPHCRDEFEATVVWMADEPLAPGRDYLFKHTTRTVSGTIRTLRHQIDINNLRRVAATTLKLNEIGKCDVRLSAPLFFDAYRRNAHTGAFIIIDRHSNMTVGAGMILEQLGPSVSGDLTTLDVPSEIEVDPARLAVATSSTTRPGARRLTAAVTLILAGGVAMHRDEVLAAVRREFEGSERSIVLLDRAVLEGLPARELGLVAAEPTAESRPRLRQWAALARLLNDQGVACVLGCDARPDEVRAEFTPWVHADHLRIVGLRSGDGFQGDANQRVAINERAAEVGADAVVDFGRQSGRVAMEVILDLLTV